MFLDLDHSHSLYYEDFGNKDSIPILFLHGGPGLGFTDRDKRFFDKELHRVIFFDQRGCGRSIFKDRLHHNTTAHLIEDITNLLDHLGIPQVHIFGGSWGSTLGILYAAQYPDRVRSLILRGFFSATPETIALYTKGKVRNVHPKAWERVCSYIPEKDRNNILKYFYESLLKKSKHSYELGFEWSRYGLSLSRKRMSEEEIDSIMSEYQDARDKIIIELHYVLNHFFIPNNHVFDQAKSIKAPVTIVHGVYDHICPIDDARKLQETLSKSTLMECDAGHSSGEVEIEQALKRALTNCS